MQRSAQTRPPFARALEWAAFPLDRLFNSLYGSRYNPLYHSGALAFWLLLVATVTGVYLLLFYRISEPYESVVRLQAQPWGGRWLRALHRYSSDAAVLTVAFHTFRMFVQGRTWGPRMLAWLSGVFLLLVLLICGWTGYAIVWDQQAQLMVRSMARMLDLLPVFSEPISRSFVGSTPLPAQFFFVNLWLHLSIPLLIMLFLWVHTMRAARPQLTPYKPLLWWSLGTLVALSVAWPATLPPPAELLALPGRVPLDLFYNFWLPLAQRVPPWVHLSGWTAFWLLLATAPWWWRPARSKRGADAVADESLCTGCSQCYLDCPYEAITMVSKTESSKTGIATAAIPTADGLPGGRVAHISAELCVSCGICAGSCAPMVIGPPAGSGRDQLRTWRVSARGGRIAPGQVVVLVCQEGLGLRSALDRLPGVSVHEVPCAGEVHTSTVEYLVRGVGAGVLVLACPERDCVQREGSRWLRERFYEGREAELQPRVDRRRVRIAHATYSDLPQALRDVRAFQAELAALEQTAADESVDLELECEVPEVSNG